MTQITSHRQAQPSTHAFTRTGNDPVNLVCTELWGGNRGFHGPIELPGIRGELFSQQREGARGGDVHYLSVCGSGLLSRACLADVTGHGQSVADVSQAMYELLRRSVNRIDERKVLRRLNLLLPRLGDQSYTTAVALTYFAPTRRLSISYAGHEPAWYYESATGNWSQLEPSHRRGLFDITLAAVPRTRYTRSTRRVAYGDRLLLMTDGIVEAPNNAGELFGRKRLGNVLRSTENCSPATLVDAIIKKVVEHSNDSSLLHDDVSLLAIEFVDNLQSPALSTMLRNRLLRRLRKNGVRS